MEDDKSKLEDDKSKLEDELTDARHEIERLKSTVRKVEEKLCKTEGELNEMNDQHVNKYKTISKLKQLSETEEHFQFGRTTLFSQFKSRNTSLKDKGASLYTGKHK